VLEAHEQELARLRERSAGMADMLALVETYLLLLHQIVAFTNEATDKDRLTSRARRDPGRLLREEKFRNTMARDVPRVRARLLIYPRVPSAYADRGFSVRQLEGAATKAVQAWEARAGVSFMMQGRRFLDCLYGERALAHLKKVRGVHMRTYTYAMHSRGRLAAVGTRARGPWCWICRGCRPSVRHSHHSGAYRARHGMSACNAN
jgi:hypothetical protein